MGIAALALPRLVNTPEFRAALAARAGQALGSPVEWQSLGIGLFPPRVTLTKPMLVGQSAAPDAEASLAAEAIDLRLSLLPLLRRRIEVDSLVLRGVVVVVSRMPEGFVLPSIGGGGPGPEASKSEEAAGEGAFTLDLREVRIEEGRAVVHDHTLAPPVDWRFESLSATARGRSLGEPLAIEAEARIFANERPLGALASEGQVSLEGTYALDLDLDGVPAPELQVFLADPKVSAGELSGRVSIAGGDGDLSKLTADLSATGLALRTRGLELHGDLALRTQGPPSGKLAFEATWSAPDSGRAEITGERTSEGDVRLTAMLAALELTPFAPLAGAGRTLAGRATGEVSLATKAGELADVETDLAIESAHYADGRIDAKGRLELALGLEGLAPEDAARVQGVFAPENGGRLDVNGTGTVGGAVRGSLRFDALDLSLLAPLLPEDTQLAGKLTGDLEVESTAERELARLASHLRIGAARLVRAPVDVAGDLVVDARIDGQGPVVVSSKATLQDGGRIELSGTSTRKGVLDLQTALVNFDLAALMPFLGSSDLSLAGRASGRGTLAGAYDALDSLALDLSIAGAAIRMGENRVDGPFEAHVEVARPLATDRRGKVGLDLALAEVAIGQSFKKPAGVRAALETTFSSEAAKGTAFESRGQLNNIGDLLVRGTVGEKTTAVALTTSSFDLKGWSGLVPALAPSEPSGALAFEGLSLERSAGAQDRFGGRIALRGVELALAKAGRVRLRGNLVGAGSRLELSSLSATLHGLTLGLEGRIEEPLADARFDIAAHSIGEAEANDFVSGLTAVRDTLFGALRVDAQLAGTAGGAASLYDTLTGNVRFTIGESGGGRLRGVSLLRTTLDAIPVLGGTARLAERLRAQPTEPDYLGEKFEILEGDLAIGSGAVDARTLRIRYRGHEARLTGRMQLEGLTLDMRGELLLDAPLVAFLSGRPVAELAGRGPVRIPLARVTNTLSDPRVSLAPETLAAVPQLLLLTTGVGGVAGKVGEAVGGAVGKAGGKLGGALGKVGEAIGKVGGGIRAPGTAPAPAPPPARDESAPSSTPTAGVDVPSPAPSGAAESPAESPAVVEPMTGDVPASAEPGPAAGAGEASAVSGGVEVGAEGRTGSAEPSAPAAPTDSTEPSAPSTPTGATERPAEGGSP